MRKSRSYSGLVNQTFCSVCTNYDVGIDYQIGSKRRKLRKNVKKEQRKTCVTMWALCIRRSKYLYVASTPARVQIKSLDGFGG